MKQKIYFLILMLFALSISLSYGQDVYEPNNTPETAAVVTCSQQLSAYIQVEGDVDWYQIEVSESGVLEVALTSAPDDLRLNLEVHQFIDNVLTLIADDRGSAGPGDDRFANAVINPGTYLVKIGIDWGTSFNDADSYELSFSCTPNALELNQTYEEAAPVALDTCFEDNIYGDNQTYTVTHDVDWFKVEVPVSGVLEIAVTSVPDDLRLNLEIYQIIDNVLTLIADDRGSAGPGDNRFANAVINPGTYLIKVGIDWGQEFNEETYSFCSGFTPNNLELNQTYEEAAPIALDTCFEDNIYGDNQTYTVTHDVDWFQVEVLGSGVLEIAVTSVPDDLRLNLEIYQVINNVLTLISDDRGTAGPGDNRFANAVINPGTYLIKVGIDWGQEFNEETYSFCSGFTPNNLELNQTYEEASPIALDTCFEDNIYGDNQTYTVTHDVDWFSLEVADNNYPLKISVTSVPDNLRLNLEVYQLIENVLTLIADDGGSAGPGDDRFVSAIVNAGTYLIKIGIDWGDDSNEEPYNFCLGYTGIDEQSLSNHVEVFPNPSNGKLQIKINSGNNDLDIRSIKVYDLSGKNMFALPQSNLLSNNVSVDLTNLTEGLYLMKIVTNKGILTKRILIK